MTDPGTLRAALVTALRQIPAVVAALGGDSANVIEYEEEDNGDLIQTIGGLTIPSLLVVYQGTNPTSGARSMWQHNFSLVVRTASSPTALMTAIINGVRTGGSGLALIYDTIHQNYHPMALPAMRRAFISVSERASKDYWEITTSFTSKGTE